MESADMKQEDIIRMAREAGLWPAVTDTFPKELKAFAALVAAASAAAAIENLIPKLADLWDIKIDAIMFDDMRREAAAIRARGQA